MNHDYCHCFDYEKGKCPEDCFLADLTEDYHKVKHELHCFTSWAHFAGTHNCKRKEDDNGQVS